MTGPLSVQEARDLINVRLQEIDELWAAVRYVVPEVRRPLTVSQRAVARAMAFSHLTLPEIAREFGVSPNTVKTHARKAFKVLGVTRRVQVREALLAAERVPGVPAAGEVA